MTAACWHNFVVVTGAGRVTIVRRSYNGCKSQNSNVMPNCAWQFKTVAHYHQNSLAHLRRWEATAPDGTAVTPARYSAHSSNVCAMRSAMASKGRGSSGRLIHVRHGRRP